MQYPWRCVTGDDYGRANHESRLAARIKFMNTYEIQNAINAAEPVSKPLGAKTEPTTVSNEVLLTLIAAAKECIERRGY